MLVRNTTWDWLQGYGFGIGSCVGASAEQADDFSGIMEHMLGRNEESINSARW